MKTHFESMNHDSLRMEEIVDEYNIFECDKGHKWRETLENRWNIPLPFHFPVPNGKDICPFCLSELLSNLGKVSITMERNNA